MRACVLFAGIFALCVIVLGAYTRLSDAGLGCPDWPGCYGHLTVPHDVVTVNHVEQHFQQTIEPEKAWIEMSHRYIAGILVLLVVFITAIGIKKRSYFPLLILLCIIWQALLGMWTVTLKLHPPIILLHLFGGLTIVSLLWWYYLITGRAAVALKYYWQPAVMLGLVLLLGQIALGGWTSANYAALICPDFPLCQGHWLPSMSWLGFVESGLGKDNAALVTIHMAHRFGALLVLGYWFVFGIVLIAGQNINRLKRLVMFIWLLLFIQATLGILNIVLLLPMLTAVLHNFVAILLVLSVLMLWQDLSTKRNHMA